MVRHERMEKNQLNIKLSLCCVISVGLNVSKNKNHAANKNKMKFLFQLSLMIPKVIRIKFVANQVFIACVTNDHMLKIMALYSSTSNILNYFCFPG